MGDDARRLELSHLYLTAPVRLNTGRPGPPGYLRRAVAALRAEPRRERDRAAARGTPRVG